MTREGQPLGKTIMIQGTGSDVGKTTIAAALCRVLRQDGYWVAPFKGWTMSLNSGVTIDGGEISRGQIIQAEAAEIEALSDMNPILLKPKPDGSSEIIIRGRVATPEEIRQFWPRNERLRIIRQSLGRIRRLHDVTVIEGSGSPSEPNRVRSDIANMGTAKINNSPVIIVGNIDKQGVYASLLGTVEILRDKDPKGFRLIKGFIINGMYGDARYLRSANRYIQKKTGIPVLGVVPFIEGYQVEDEDSTGLIDRQILKPNAVLDIVVPYVEGQTLQNTDDIMPLEKDPHVRVRYIKNAEEFGNPDLVILCGSKGTVSDLKLLEKAGIADKIIEYGHQGGAVIGICGGYQMLGKELHDPLGIESSDEVTKGLGLLPAITTFEPQKAVRRITARIQDGKGILANIPNQEINGYEIHMGRTNSSGDPLLRVSTLTGRDESYWDGTIESNGWIVGTYIHGFLKNHGIQRAILENIALKNGKYLPINEDFDSADPYDQLASQFRRSVNMKAVYNNLNIRSR
jgi:adenosylcobyric acid synthase